jgi:hypothetical protein
MSLARQILRQSQIRKGRLVLGAVWYHPVGLRAVRLFSSSTSLGHVLAVILEACSIAVAVAKPPSICVKFPVTAGASALEALGRLVLPQRLYAPPPLPCRDLLYWRHSGQLAYYLAALAVVSLPAQVRASCGTVEVVVLSGSGGHG